jgi:hypothetical protein
MSAESTEDNLVADVFEISDNPGWGTLSISQGSAGFPSSLELFLDFPDGLLGGCWRRYDWLCKGSGGLMGEGG